VISFRPQLLYLSGSNPCNYWLEGWASRRGSLDVVVKWKILPCWETNPDHTAHSLVTALAEPSPTTKSKLNLLNSSSYYTLISTDASIRDSNINYIDVITKNF